MRSLKLSQSFGCWVEAVAEVSRIRAVLDRALRRLLNRQLSQAFQAWQQNASENAWLEAFGAKLLIKWKHRELSKALCRWTDFAAEDKNQRHLVRSCLGRINGREVSRAFNSWLGAIAELRQQRTAVARSLGRMHSRLLFTAFESWWANAADLRRQRNICFQIVKRMQERCVHAAVAPSAPSRIHRLPRCRLLCFSRPLISSFPFALSLFLPLPDIVCPSPLYLAQCGSCSNNCFRLSCFPVGLGTPRWPGSRGRRRSSTASSPFAASARCRTALSRALSPLFGTISSEPGKPRPSSAAPSPRSRRAFSSRHSGAGGRPPQRSWRGAGAPNLSFGASSTAASPAHSLAGRFGPPTSETCAPRSTM